MVKTNPTKIYTVNGVSVFGNDSNGPQAELIEFDQLYKTIDDAARAVADAVNEVLAEDGKRKRVNVKSCYEGYTLELDTGRWVYRIVAHERPWIVTRMNCDDRTVEFATHMTKDEAERDVVAAAKSTLAEVSPETLTVNHHCETEIDPAELGESEAYVDIDTTDGNYISINSSQI